MQTKSNYIPYKTKVSEQERLKETKWKREIYPTLVPIIIESQLTLSKLPQLDRPKYLVSEELKLFDLYQSIRTKLELAKSDSLIFFIAGRQLDKLDTTLKTVYEKYGDHDGFLYISYSDMAVSGTNIQQ